MNYESGPNTSAEPRLIGRRALMKIGAGAGLSAALSSAASSQESVSLSKPPDETTTGWTNNANRASGNGPMDETTLQIVEYTRSFSPSNLTDSVIDAVSRTMLDSVACLISGFEAEPVRIAARMSRSIRSDRTSTIFGYGITTSPDMAAFANGCMIRFSDFNDVSPGGHFSDMIPTIVSVGEAFHATGLEVLAAVVLAYEVAGALAVAGATPKGWDSPFELPATAMAAGKLMSLNADQLANALSLAMVPHMPMSVSHEGTLSMWKGCHAAELGRCAVFAAMLAREGMTGPCQPFDARGGLFSHIGTFKNLHLPAPGGNGRMVVERTVYKRHPSEAATQPVLELIPEVKSWTDPKEISSIVIDLPRSWWQELADPPKWDPRNHETADHSLPYVVCRALIDGQIYLDSFTPEKLMDPFVRELMAVTVVRPNSADAGAGLSLDGVVRLTVRTKSGGELSKESRLDSTKQMTRDEIIAKFNRACVFRGISAEQQDRAREQWLSLRGARDLKDAIDTFASFGRPAPL